jgi:hypothetical protein
MQTAAKEDFWALKIALLSPVASAVTDIPRVDKKCTITLS